MALFKIFGNFASGNTTLPEAANQGYCYFDKNTGKFYVDTATSNTATLGTNRLALNADKADKDSSGNNIIDTYLTKANGITDVSFNGSNRKLQKTINGTTSDITTLAIVPGGGTNSAVGGLTGSDVSTATGEGSFAFGSKSNATAKCAVAIGLQAQATNQYAVAIGGYHASLGQVTASGAASVALGMASHAEGHYSLAVGQQAYAQSYAGVSIGVNTVTKGQYAVSLGNHTNAFGKGSFAIGKYNKTENEETLTAHATAGYGYIDGTYAFMIGNGTADDARSNALTVDWTGNTEITGALTTSNIHISPNSSHSVEINNTCIDGDPAFIDLNNNYLKLRFSDEESNSIELGNNGLIINDGTGVGASGQALLSDGTKAYWGAISTGDTKVTQNAAITTAGEYPVILANSTATTAITDSVNKTSTLTYNPNTQILTSPKVSADNIYVGAASYGDTLPATGTTGQIFFVTDNEEGETVTATDISNWNNKSTVSITRNLTSGTKVGTITIDGTSTDLYCQTNTDTKTRQTLYSSNYNLPLLMSYQTITNTTTNIDNVTYRNNSIYANPSSQTIFTPNLQITTTLKAPTTSGGTTYDVGSNGQVLTSNGTSVYWGNVSTTLKFENITVQSTSWVADTTYTDFGYKAPITCNGVTSNHIPTVIFDYTELTSGNYCPYADSGTDTVYIYSKVQDTITIPTIYCV